MRRLLLAVLLACSGSLFALGAAAPAYACSCAQVTFAEQLDAADTVVAGSVVEVQESGGIDSRTFVVEVDRLYRGEGVAGTVEVTSPVSPAGCGLPDLDLDAPHLFLLTDELEGYSATVCLAPRPMTAALAERLDRRGLGEGTPIEQPAPAELTPVAGSEPRSLTRLAAPGGAMVIVGLLGLVLVRTLVRD